MGKQPDDGDVELLNCRLKILNRPLYRKLKINNNYVSGNFAVKYSNLSLIWSSDNGINEKFTFVLNDGDDMIITNKSSVTNAKIELRNWQKNLIVRLLGQLSGREIKLQDQKLYKKGSQKSGPDKKPRKQGEQKNDDSDKCLKILN